MNLEARRFVFELAGEILTNSEMMQRNHKWHQQMGFKQSYSLHLDAHWPSECTTTDNIALCIDTTFFGNVARFMNHR